MSLPTENASRITVTVDVPFSQQKAFEQWIQLVWLDGGGMGSPTIEEEGDMKAHRCGCIRSGPFPIYSHFATVSFNCKESSSLEPEVTQIRWQCDMDIPFLLRWPVAGITYIAFRCMLLYQSKYMK
eukprot:gene3190-8227_t